MRDIPGFEERYAVTESGEVWSYARTWTTGDRNTRLGHEGKWLKHYITSKGYHQVSLYKIENKQKFSRSYGVHRLVAFTYLEKPISEKTHVNHIDYNPSNNHFTNLEWVTRSENALHSAKIGKYSRAGTSNGRFKYNLTIVNEVKEHLNNGYTVAETSRKFNIPFSSLAAIRDGKLRGY